MFQINPGLKDRMFPSHPSDPLPAQPHGAQAVSEDLLQGGAPLPAMMAQRMGSDFASGMQQATQRSAPAVLAAWNQACAACDAEALWRRMDVLAEQRPAAAARGVTRLLCTLLERVTRWRLSGKQGAEAIADLLAHYVHSIKIVLTQCEQGVTEPRDDALEMLEQALLAAPGALSLHLTLALEKRAQGDHEGADTHLIAAQILQDAGPALDQHALGPLCAAAARYFVRGDDPSAQRWYLLALRLNPQLASAYQNLAVIYQRNGHAEQAAFCRTRAYQIQRVFIDAPPGAQRRLLLLYSGLQAGNVPLDTLLGTGRTCQIRYAIDCAAPDEDQALPPYDLVFNAVGDADVALGLQARLQRFEQHCPLPLLNPPAAVLRTRRHLIHLLLGDLADVALAPCILLAPPLSANAALPRALEAGGVAFPLLARPLASHGGQGLVRHAQLATLQDALRRSPDAHYLSRFIDTRCADGYYRKYRILFVDRVPYPCHLAISSDWMVHYFSAEMAQHDWKLDEERRFLRDPAAALGAQAWAAILAIGRRLDLDYGGIDCTLLANGQVLVFEANAAMLTHFEDEQGPLAHKNPAVRTLIAAFERMLQGRDPACQARGAL